jgi:hypothetical protein
MAEKIITQQIYRDSFAGVALNTSWLSATGNELPVPPSARFRAGDIGD